METSLPHLLKQLTPGAPDLVRLVLALAVALVVAYGFNWVLERLLRRLSRVISRYTDTAPSETRFQQLRRAETFVSIAMAVTRTVLILLAILIAWQIANPQTTSFAVIGASTIFLVLAGATITPLLRDITYGFVMTAERWYNVGDHIAVDPFIGVSGVVEQVTLRSTRLRSLTGEVIWLHNQHIQGVRVLPGAMRTIALDVFVNDLATGTNVITAAIATLPSGPTMLARKMAIKEFEQVGDKLWRIMAVGQTVPGREWLVEEFAVEAIKEQDKLGDAPTIVHGPMVHYIDAMAEKRFRRSVRKNPA